MRVGLDFFFWVVRTRRGSGVERTSGGRPRPRKTECDICEANSSEMPRISCVDSRETESLMVHQKITASSEAVIFYPSRRRGMASRFCVYGIPTSSGMVSVEGCINLSLRLDSIQYIALIPCDTLCQFHTATSCGFNTMLRIDLVRKIENRLKQGFGLAFFF